MGDVALQDISQQILEGCSKDSRKQRSSTEHVLSLAIESPVFLVMPSWLIACTI